MKFNNFDINDVFNANDVKNVKKYLNQKGYFADTLEDLDDNLSLYNPRLGSSSIYVGTLTRIYVKYGSYAFGNDSGIEFKYFLPYSKAKNKKFFGLFKSSCRTEENKVEYRPCENIKEVMNLIGIGSRKTDLIGIVVTLKNKTVGTIIRTLVTGVLEFDDGTCDIVLGNTQFTLKDVFDIYEIRIDDEYQPFGVEIND